MLGAFPSAGLVPPSPFNLDGQKKEMPEKLDNSGPLSRKGGKGKRCVVEYININGVDEPFYSYVDDDDDEPPSLVEGSDSVKGLLPPSSDFLSLYE